MGEIADAIRRARRQAGGAEREVGLPTLEPVAAPGPQRPRELRAAAPRLDVDTLEPENEAIILEDGPNAEACRHVALRLRSELRAREARSVAIVSAERGDGKSTIICDLGIALASLSRGRAVAIVDLDLRNPSLSRYLSVVPSQSLEDLLIGSATLDEVRVSIEQPAIDVYPAVRPLRAAHERIVMQDFAEMIAELERRYEIVLVDTPPALLVPDANLVLGHVATYACVVRAGKTRARSIRQLMDVLPRGQFVGTILNCKRTSGLRYKDYYYPPADGIGDGSEAP